MRAITWNGESFSYPTEVEIRRMLRATINHKYQGPDKHERVRDFEDILDQYTSFRAGIDTRFYNTPSAVDKERWTEFCIDEDTISIERETHDCYGDLVSEHFEFPTEHLWAQDWEAVIRKDIEERQAKAAAQQAREAEQHEKEEKKMLLSLLEKYGIPKEYTPKEPA